MALRIAFDLDGVLADMDGQLRRHATDLFGEAAALVSDEAAGPADKRADGDAPTDEMPMDIMPGLSSRQQRELWAHVRRLPNFWETLPELEPGVIERLSETARQRGWEVIFLTKRPSTAGATAQLQSQLWLESKGFLLPSVYVVQGSRGRIAAALALDVVVDDRPENCLDVMVESKARAFLVCRNPRAVLPAAARRLGIQSVASVEGVLQLLMPSSAAVPDVTGGMLSGVLKALRLSRSARAS